MCRVLTHSDETIRNICLPTVTVGEEVELEEEKVKVLWRPARLEAWLDIHSNNIGISVGKQI